MSEITQAGRNWPVRVTVTYADGTSRTADYAEDFEPFGFARHVSEASNVVRVDVATSFIGGWQVAPAALEGEHVMTTTQDTRQPDEDREFDARTILARAGFPPDPCRRFSLDLLEALAGVIETWGDEAEPIPATQAVAGPGAIPGNKGPSGTSRTGCP
jgi:hypothetical protein